MWQAVIRLFRAAFSFKGVNIVGTMELARVSTVRSCQTAAG